MILAALAALALATSAPPSFAQKIDKNGRCHDASGKFAKDDVCKGAAGATASTKSAAGGSATAAGGASKGAAAKPAAAADANGPYKLDAKGKCHDAKGKMAAKAKCA
jgi:hypothetical protein